MSFARFSTLSILLGVLALAASAKERPFKLYRLDLGRVEAAALAPDGSQVAVIRTEGVLNSSAAGIGPDPSGNLEVWDFRAGKLLFKKERIWDVEGDRKNETLRDITALTPRILEYTPDGHELVYSDGKVVHILDATDYHQVREFPAMPRANSQGDDWTVRTLVISPDGSRIAVRSGDSGSGNFLLRVYDLDSGKMEREWRLSDGCFLCGTNRLSWSPDGKELAVTLLPLDTSENTLPPDVRNLYILDVGSGVQVRAINTGHPARGVAFASPDAVLTVSMNPALGPARKDTIRIWDVKTGELLREVSSPPDGVRAEVEVSADRRVALGYTHKARSYPGNDLDVVEEGFRLWDSESWNAVFTSPHIPNPNRMGGASICLAINRTGHIVMVWWDGIQTPIQIYEIQ